MIDERSKKAIRNIINGNVIQGPESIVESVRNHLIRSTQTNSSIEKKQQEFTYFKEIEGGVLKEFIRSESLLLDISPLDRFYLDEGGEARVYFNPPDFVIKINDAIYYKSWIDFFNSVLFHNLLFPETSYELLGFVEENNLIKAVLKQRYVQLTEFTDLKKVKLFLEFNGFKNTKRNDYVNTDLRLLLEDIHEENVLVRDNVLFFIDTVFFVLP